MLIVIVFYCLADGLLVLAAVVTGKESFKNLFKGDMRTLDTL